MSLTSASPDAPLTEAQRIQLRAVAGAAMDLNRLRGGNRRFVEGTFEALVMSRPASERDALIASFTHNPATVKSAVDRLTEIPLTHREQSRAELTRLFRNLNRTSAEAQAIVREHPWLQSLIANFQERAAQKRLRRDIEAAGRSGGFGGESGGDGGGGDGGEGGSAAIRTGGRVAGGRGTSALGGELFEPSWPASGRRFRELQPGEFGPHHPDSDGARRERSEAAIRDGTAYGPPIPEHLRTTQRPDAPNPEVAADPAPQRRQVAAMPQHHMAPSA